MNCLFRCAVIVEKSFVEMPTDQEVSELLLDLEKRGVNIIWSNSMVQTSAAIVKALHKLGLSNKIFLLGSSQVCVIESENKDINKLSKSINQKFQPLYQLNI